MGMDASRNRTGQVLNSQRRRLALGLKHSSRLGVDLLKLCSQERPLGALLHSVPICSGAIRTWQCSAALPSWGLACLAMGQLRVAQEPCDKLSLPSHGSPAIHIQGGGGFTVTRSFK